ncbi:hypothetical protein DFH09DRAFT_1426335 [Mycena vulgaris]|nr:hypothetical protein DFH09DRAFT_1426335 [Mycena vulgaris]
MCRAVAGIDFTERKRRTHGKNDGWSRPDRKPAQNPELNQIERQLTREHAATRSGEALVATAKSYLPAQDDVQRAMTNAGQTAKAYLPQGVAAYLPSASSEPSSDLTPPRPPFATDDRASTNLSTEAQAGSIGPPHLDSPDLDNLSTLVHTGGPASLHPVTPLGSRFAENLVMPPGLASPPNLSHAAPPAIPPPPTSTTTDTQRAGPDVAAPSP